MKSILLSLSFILSSICSFGQLPSFTKQSKETIILFLNDNKVPVDIKDLVTLKDVNVFSYYNSTEKLTVPEAYFFNKDGYRVKNFNGTSCGNEITGLKKINKKSFDKDDSIKDWVKNFTFFKQDGEDLLNSGYDFFIVINWATFLPTENEVSFNWYKTLKEQKEYKIKIFLSNLDIQKDWELTQAQKDALHLE